MILNNLSKEELAFLKLCKEFGIVDNYELSHIFGQVKTECSFKNFEESFNYTPSGLLNTFPSYFTAETAEKYGRTNSKIASQQTIANIAYRNRLGNTEYEDGWLYRGRGAIQITGKYNYKQFNDYIKKQFGDDVDFIKNPELLATDKYKYLTAIWYWINNDIKKLIPKNDLTAITKIIKGSTNGFEQRKINYSYYVSNIFI